MSITKKLVSSVLVTVLLSLPALQANALPVTITVGPGVVVEVCVHVPFVGDYCYTIN